MVDLAKLGIPFCINCVGHHPDEAYTDYNMIMRATDPAKYAFKAASAMKHKTHVYANKLCTYCGRYYDANAQVDETYKMTAKFVKQEFDAQGVYGVDDLQINHVVATCRKSVQKLFRDKDAVKIRAINIMRKGGTLEQANEETSMRTFSGCLAMIIAGAIEGRRMKHGNFSEMSMMHKDGQ